MSGKVLIITYYWPPSGGAGVQRWLKFVKYLPEFGWEPVVLTVDPEKASYGQKDESLGNEIREGVKVHYTSTFELYSVYQRFSSKKEIPYGGFSNEGNISLFQRFSRFVRGNFFLPDPRKGWNRFAYKKAKELIRKYGIDTVITTSPPHSTQLVGLKLKKHLGINWVADLRDPWTDIYYYNEFNHTLLARWMDRRSERKVLTGADQLITVSPALKRLFLAKAKGIFEDKIAVIPNGYDEDDFPEKAEHLDPGRFVISYTGTIVESYDLSGFILAIKSLPESFRNKVLLRFVGNVPETIVNQFRQAGLEKNLDLVGYVAHKQSVEYLFASDILLLVIPNVSLNEGIITGKLFEYLAAKKPILFIGPIHGDAAKIVLECEAGVVFDYGDGEGMLSFLNHPSHDIVTGNKAHEYSRRQLTLKLVKELDRNEK